MFATDTLMCRTNKTSHRNTYFAMKVQRQQVTTQTEIDALVKHTQGGLTSGDIAVAPTLATGYPCIADQTLIRCLPGCNISKIMVDLHILTLYGI